MSSFRWSKFAGETSFSLSFSKSARLRIVFLKKIKKIKGFGFECNYMACIYDPCTQPESFARNLLIYQMLGLTGSFRLSYYEFLPLLRQTRSTIDITIQLYKGTLLLCTSRKKAVWRMTLEVRYRRFTIRGPGLTVFGTSSGDHPARTLAIPVGGYCKCTTSLQLGNNFNCLVRLQGLP